jgi:hypothetical protein
MSDIDYNKGIEMIMDNEQQRLDIAISSTKQEKFLIHRSAILSYKSCPYKAYLEYWYKGHGVSATALPQHLLIGVCIHRGLQHLLEHCRIEHPNGDFTEKCIDDAVMWAHKVYVDILQNREIELKRFKLNGEWEVEDLNYTVREIHALIEALIRSFAIARLKSFLDEYEVLEVEKEEVFEDFSSIVTWLGKADGLLRRKSDNELVVLSFKTAAEFSNSTMFNILIDMQGCSEIVAVEDRLNRKYQIFLYDTTREPDFEDDEINIWCSNMEITEGLWSYFCKSKYANIKEIKVFANQYEYLVKGKHRADKDEPLKFKYQTPLLHPIKSDSMAVIQLGSGLRFGAKSSDEYEWKIPQGKLPKGKRKIDIVDDIGVKEWINKLASLQVQPEEGNPFQDIIIGGEDRLAKRSLNQLKEWRISTQFEAEEIAGYVEVLRILQSKIDFANEDIELHKDFLNNSIELFQTKLLQYFSRDGKDAQLCYNYYGGSCPFTAHCHNNMHIDDGLESGLYIIRTPHHEAEIERFKEKGYLKDE